MLFFDASSVAKVKSMIVLPRLVTNVGIESIFSMLRSVIRHSTSCSPLSLSDFITQSVWCAFESLSVVAQHLHSN